MNTAAKELAACYTRTFASEDGRRVLADLTRKFGGHRLRHGELIRHIASDNPNRPAPKPCNVTATLIDGQASVIAEINEAIAAGKYSPE